MKSAASLEGLESRTLLAGDFLPASFTTVVASGVDNQVLNATTPDGKILVARSGFLHRYLGNGTADSSFGGGDGVIELPAGRFPSLVEMQDAPNGKIYIAGSSRAGSNTDFTVVRLSPDGSLDTTFGANGFALAD